MKNIVTTKSFLPVLLVSGMSLAAHADDQIPSQFQGRWNLDIEATTAAVEADDSMPEEVVSAWQTSKDAVIQYDYIISTDTIRSEMRIKGRDERRDGVPERGAYQVEADGERDGFMVFVMRQDPRHCPSGCSPEQQQFFHLRVRDDGSLQLRESKLSGWDRNDSLAQLFVYRKSDGGGNAENDAVAYLDGLKSCSPGQHRFSYTSLGEFENTIIGPGEAGCRVDMVANGMKLHCEFSKQTIELLTRPEKYEEARNGVLQGSTDSGESDSLNRECVADSL